ncbi:MAG: methyltransferase domain-containing protein [Gammaproteobacteria bacterium]
MTPDLADLYTDEFYGHHVAGSTRSAGHFLRHLFTYFKPASMVDFGAGVGAWLATARKLGVADLLAVDGDWARSPKKVDPAVPYFHTDLETPIRLERRFDLAMSVEVAEHLQESRAAGFIEDLTLASDIVLFGAAMKDQGGVNHINEQDQYYWINLFADLQYEYVDFFRAPFWRNTEVEPWYIQNTFLFVSSGHPALETIPSFPLVEVHHPRLLLTPAQLVKYGIKVG